MHFGGSGDTFNMSGDFRYTSLGGDPSSIPVSQLWVCPQEWCDESLPVIQAGEDAPTCKEHDLAMILGNEKKG